MKKDTIQTKIKKSRGRFMRINLKSAKSSECFMGKVKSLGEKFVTFSRFSGKRGEVKVHRDTVKSIAVV